MTAWIIIVPFVLVFLHIATVLVIRALKSDIAGVQNIVSSSQGDIKNVQDTVNSNLTMVQEKLETALELIGKLKSEVLQLEEALVAEKEDSLRKKESLRKLSDAD